MLRMSSHTTFIEIACRQVMTGDAPVFSVQWAVLPQKAAGALSPDELLMRYLGHIRKCTFSMIRPVTVENGIEFRLFKSHLSLISFLPAAHTDDFATLRIRGGFLVQPRQRNRGELRFGVEHQSDGMRVSPQLTDFCPLILGNPSPSVIRFWLYRLTQATLHRLVVRFLSLLYHELVGPSAGVRIKKVAVRAGIPV